MTGASAISSGKDQEAPKPSKKARGLVVIDIQRCKGCAFCVEFCPLGVLAMAAKLNAGGHHYPKVVAADKCSGCDLCGMYCPDFAIHGARVPDPDSTGE